MYVYITNKVLAIHLYFLCYRVYMQLVHAKCYGLKLFNLHNLLFQDCVVCDVWRSLPSGANSRAAASPSELLAKFNPAGHHHPGNLPRV